MAALESLQDIIATLCELKDIPLNRESGKSYKQAVIISID